MFSIHHSTHAWTSFMYETTHRPDHPCLTRPSIPFSRTTRYICHQQESSWLPRRRRRHVTILAIYTRLAKIVQQHARTFFKVVLVSISNDVSALSKKDLVVVVVLLSSPNKNDGYCCSLLFIDSVFFCFESLFRQKKSHRSLRFHALSKWHGRLVLRWFLLVSGPQIIIFNFASSSSSSLDAYIYLLHSGSLTSVILHEKVTHYLIALRRSDFLLEVSK